MKNYLSKIKKFKIKNYISNFRKKNPFNPIILSIILVFLLSLYFTIPTFYNYENFDKEIQKKVSSGTGYDDAFYEEAEQEYGLFHKYDKILEKNKIYSVSDTADIPEDLDYMYHTPKEREEYDGEHEFLSRIFSDFREAYFNYPYNEKDNKRLGPTHYFYLQYKKYSFFVGFDALTTENSDFIYIKIFF